jgi:hypothetical protein
VTFRTRVLFAGLLLLIGTVLAFLIAANGPSKFVPFGTGSFLDRLAATIGRALGGGVVEAGSRGNFQEVPKAETWVVSLRAGALFLAGSIFVVVRRGKASDI